MTTRHLHNRNRWNRRGKVLRARLHSDAGPASSSSPPCARLYHRNQPVAEMKPFSATALALALVAPAKAGLRFGCSTLTIQRLDPIVEPGAVPSSHLHHIVGGNAFNASMGADIGDRGTCTTCQMSEDFSNYWTAVLYFKHPTNGSYHRVPVTNNAALAPGTTGGITVYYTQFDFNTDALNRQPIKAFPPVSASYCGGITRLHNSNLLCLPGLPYDSWKPRRQRPCCSQVRRRIALQLPSDSD